MAHRSVTTGERKDCSSVDVDLRLKPDYENYPIWLQEELTMLAERHRNLPEVEQKVAVRADLSAQAEGWFLDQALRAAIAQVAIKG